VIIFGRGIKFWVFVFVCLISFSIFNLYWSIESYDKIFNFPFTSISRIWLCFKSRFGVLRWTIRIYNSLHSTYIRFNLCFSSLG
jgi:hypothetical protein